MIGLVCTRAGCGWFWGVEQGETDRLAVLLMASHLLLLRNPHNAESWKKQGEKTQQLVQKNHLEVWGKILEMWTRKKSPLIKVNVAQQVPDTRTELKFFQYQIRT